MFAFIRTKSFVLINDVFVKVTSPFAFTLQIESPLFPEGFVPIEVKKLVSFAGLNPTGNTQSNFKYKKK